jgi:hypothetical protein
MTEQPSSDMVWHLINRIEREEASLTPRAIAKIHAILDDCNIDYFPDTGSQTEQAKWIKNRINREDGDGSTATP